jgi:hypothetical protein
MLVPVVEITRCSGSLCLSCVTYTSYRVALEACAAYAVLNLLTDFCVFFEFISKVVKVDWSYGYVSLEN